MIITSDLITKKQIEQKLGLSHATIWRWVKRGWLSQPIKIGFRSYWKLNDIEALILAQNPHLIEAQ
ncbi:MAG: AlpA family phage regulatory protein [Gallionellaceae bacterium]|nr:AlpA family phage regulatory protein [Gallionellaceae bacterium]